MGRIITAKFISGSHFAQAFGNLWQYDYGAKLILEGLELPVAAEIHFASMECGGESETRIGVTADGITEVKIPDALLEMAKTQDYNLYAFVYLDDGKSGQTEYKILMTVRARPKPGEEHPGTEKDHPLADAVQAVNAAADRAETAAGNAAESKAAAEDAAEQADKSRVAAETVARHVAEAGRTALTDIASAKTDAAETIETAKTGAVKAVDAAGETGVKAVTDARTAAEQSLSEAKTDGVAAIETAKTEGLKATDKAKGDIETARSGAIKDIDAAKTSGVQAVEAVTAGIEQTKTSALEEIGSSKTAAVQAVNAAENKGVAAVNAAVEAGKTNFVTDESLTLSGRAADAKVVGDELAKKADRTELEYLRKRQNVLVGSETGSRVCVTDAFEAPLEGLVLYGKSTQVTTTGAQLFEAISNKLNSNGITITFDENGEKIVVSGTPERSQAIQISKPIQMQAGEKYVLTLDEANYFENIWLRSSNDVSFGWLGKNVNNRVIITVPDSIAERTDCVMYASALEGEVYNFTINHLMLNAGDTALPWEPYTGGKPSPSPDYPQEIQSAKSEVVVHGKNLFGGRFYYANYSNDVLKIDGNRKENEVKLPFAPTYETFGVCNAIKCRKGKTYIISVTNPNKNAVVGMAEYETIEKAIDINNALGFVEMSYKALKKSYIAKSDGILVCGIAGSWTDGKTTLHECTESELLQVEEASEATDYEPYRPPQPLTLTSPASLSGIPVDSGGNYTDSTGQQWICDEVDLERGVYVQRIGVLTLDDKSMISSMSKWDNNHLDVVQPYRVNNFTMSKRKVICDRLPSEERREAWGRDIEMIGGAGETLQLDFYIKNQRLGTTKDTSTDDAVSAALKWLKENPLSCKYALATPIETPLSETDIAAYRALTTYGPTTIVETDGVGVQLDYQRDVNIVIKQLTDTIASMTN